MRHGGNCAERVMKPFAVGMLACGPVEIAEVAQARPQCLDSTKLGGKTQETDPRNRGVGFGHCAPLKSAASRVFQCRQPLSGSVTDHQSRAGTSQDATKAAIRRIAMGSARSGA